MLVYQQIMMYISKLNPEDFPILDTTYNSETHRDVGTLRVTEKNDSFVEESII